MFFAFAFALDFGVLDWEVLSFATTEIEGGIFPLFVVEEEDLAVCVLW